jgi:putative transposase
MPVSLPPPEVFGDSFDNALAENLWSTIKVEPIYWAATAFTTRLQAQ